MIYVYANLKKFEIKLRSDINIKIKIDLMMNKSSAVFEKDVEDIENSERTEKSDTENAEETEDIDETEEAEDAEDDKNIPKKRGRKPKAKPDVDISEIQKKKRGRKKKCEMNLETYKKMSGLSELTTTTLLDENKIVFDESCNSDITFLSKNVEPKNEGYFDSFIIPQQEESFISANKEVCIANSKCEINLDTVIDDIDTPVQEPRIPKADANKDLCDFFGMTDTKVDLKQKKKNKPTKTSGTENVAILKVLKGKAFEYPNKSDLWCWWCSHPFDTPPRFFPTKYDEIRKRFKVCGNFCSWGCVKSFMLSDTVYSSKVSMSILNLLIKSIHGSTYDIPCAPPRCMLKVFGGNMTIDEFRNIDKNQYFEVNISKISIDDDVFVKKRIY